MYQVLLAASPRVSVPHAQPSLSICYSCVAFSGSTVNYKHQIITSNSIPVHPSLFFLGLCYRTGKACDNWNTSVFWYHAVRSRLKTLWQYSSTSWFFPSFRITMSMKTFLFNKCIISLYYVSGASPISVFCQCCGIAWRTSTVSVAGSNYSILFSTTTHTLK